MDPARAEIAFRMMTDPTTCTPSDVETIFYLEGRLQRYFERTNEPANAVGHVVRAPDSLQVIDVAASHADESMIPLARS
jgi:hypothetical protein